MEKATYQHCGSKKDNNSPRSDIESEKDRFQPWFAQAVGILWCPLCSKKLEKKGWYEFIPASNNTCQKILLLLSNLDFFDLFLIVNKFQNSHRSGIA